MQIKDQLRVRMEQLGITVNELAKRIGVSNQSVRHWLNGRSFPGKRHVPDLEKALSTKLDFSEGATPAAAPTVESTLQRMDIELFLTISRLPPEIKMLVYRLAEAILKQNERIPVAEEDSLPGDVRHSAARRPAQAAR